MQPTLVAGDTLDFLTSVAGYPATDGWTLKFVLVPRASAGSVINITATTSDSDYRAQVAPATTATWAAGNYSWYSYVEKTGARYQVDNGQCEIKANPATLAAGADTRDHVAKALDAIEAVIERRATMDQESFTIQLPNGSSRQVGRTPIPELLKLRQRYKAELASQEAAARLANGLGGAPRLQVRF